MKSELFNDMDSITVSLKNITKEYGGKQIIDHLSYQFEKGSKTAIVAPSGTGKTTLLRLIAGLIKPDSGTINYDKTLHASIVFQEDRLLEYTSSLETIKAVLPTRFCSDQAICNELAKVGLLEAAYRRVSFLSGGMKRRIAIVRAIMMPGNLVILDEPFKELDKALKQQVMNYVAERIQDRTFILVTHNQTEAEYFQTNILNLCKKENNQ